MVREREMGKNEEREVRSDKIEFVLGWNKEKFVRECERWTDIDLRNSWNLL